MSKTWSIKIGRVQGTVQYYYEHVWCRETREGWPLLTVETEVNGDSKSSNERGGLPWLVCWTCVAGTRDFCSALAALGSPVQNIFFLTVHYFNSFV
jgi:hypothetical protein